MKYLEFDIKNMTITRTAGDKVTLVSGAVNYFGLHFNFDEEFEALTGLKYVEFYKNRRNIKKELINGSCVIPNEMLTDKTAFDVRAINGDMVATPWISVTVTESGTILPESPEEELPDTMSYVKSLIGDNSVALLRKGDAGLEFSPNGSDWESGVSGVPEVPKTPKNATYLRKNGDWVQYEVPETVEGMLGSATEIAELASDADSAAVIGKMNEIIGILKMRGVTV